MAGGAGQSGGQSQGSNFGGGQSGAHQGMSMGQQAPSFASGLGRPTMNMANPLAQPAVNQQPVLNMANPLAQPAVNQQPVLNMANPLAQPQNQQPIMNMANPMAQVQNTGGPDVTGSAQGGGYAFDQSGNDGGVGGQAVMQRQSPMGGRPPMLSDFRNRQGMQVQGNPSSQPVQRGIGAFGMGRRQPR